MSLGAANWFTHTHTQRDAEVVCICMYICVCVCVRVGPCVCADRFLLEDCFITRITFSSLYNRYICCSIHTIYAHSHIQYTHTEHTHTHPCSMICICRGALLFYKRLFLLSARSFVLFVSALVVSRWQLSLSHSLALSHSHSLCCQDKNSFFMFFTRCCCCC